MRFNTKQLYRRQAERMAQQPVQPQNYNYLNQISQFGRLQDGTNAPHYLADAIQREFIGGGDVAGQIGDVRQGLAAQRGYRQRANRALDPSALYGMTQDFYGTARRTAESQGRNDGYALLAQGYGQNVADAAGIAARNRAAGMSGQFLRENMGREGELGRALQGLQLNDPTQVMSLMPILSQLQQLALARDQHESQHNARNQSRGGFLGSLLGTLAGGLDWGSIFKRPSGGSSTSDYNGGNA